MNFSRKKDFMDGDSPTWYVFTYITYNFIHYTLERVVDHRRLSVKTPRGQPRHTQGVRSAPVALVAVGFGGVAVIQ